MPEDASLDDFAVDDPVATDDTDGASDDNVEVAGDASDDGAADVADDDDDAVADNASVSDGATAGDDATPDDAASPDSSPDPATATYRWSSESAACPDCGDAVERRWRDDDRFVCVDCKEW